MRFAPEELIQPKKAKKINKEDSMSELRVLWGGSSRRSSTTLIYRVRLYDGVAPAPVPHIVHPLRGMPCLVCK